MVGRDILHSWVVVAMVVVVTNVKVTLASTQPNTPGSTDTSRLQEVQEEFLNVVGNSTMSVKSVGDLMGMLHSQTGQHMGRLLLEGIMLGAAQKDTGTLLSHFWTELQGRLSPELQVIAKDYSDFFASLDMTTLPLAWEKMFKKDKLGNSLADMPMGQLVDLLQPAASRYGVDLVAFMNSVTGKGKNNLKDLIFGALDNLDMMSVLSQFLNSTSPGNDVQTMETEPEPEPAAAAGSRPKTGVKPKKGKGDVTLRLFRPLITSLLRENKIDLDADAVLEVLSPLLSGDMLSQATPLLAALGSQAGDGLAPLIGNLLGGEDGKGMQSQMGALLGGVGALLGGGGEQRMDLGTMMSMASMFMNTGKANNRGTKKKDTKVKSPPAPAKPDLGTLANLAGILAKNNDIDINSLLETASGLLTSGTKKNTLPTKEIRKETLKPNAQKPLKENTENDRDQSTSSRRSRKPNNLIDIMEPILLSMQTDKQCNSKIKDAILFSKAFFTKKMSGVGDLTELLPHLISMSGGDFISKKELDSLMVTLKRNLAHATWTDLMESLEREEYRESLGKSITPALAELLNLLAMSEVQQRLYEVAVPRTQALLASYGMPGITLDNFPERVAPMMGLMTRGWNLPFKPTAFLVPLRDYLQGLREWATAGLTSLRDLQSKEHLQAVVRVSLKEVGDGVMAVAKKTRGTKAECLPLVLCRINRAIHPASLAAATTRIASLVFAAGPALEESDSSLLIKIVQAASGKVDNCEAEFSSGCTYSAAEHEGNQAYEHQEL